MGKRATSESFRNIRSVRSVRTGSAGRILMWTSAEWLSHRLQVAYVQAGLPFICDPEHAGGGPYLTRRCSGQVAKGPLEVME